MAAMNYYNNNQTLTALKTYTGIISDLCTPLYPLGVNFFTYSQIYNDDTGVFLCNKDQWYDTKFSQNLFEQEGFITLQEIYKNTFTKKIFYGKPSRSNKVLGHLFDQDFWNSIDLYLYQENYMEVFHFAANRSNEKIIDFYLNNLTLLEEFCFYFKQKIAPLIVQNKKDIQIKIHNTSKLTLIESNAKLTLPVKQMLDFNAPFFVHNNRINLSKRQIECLSLLQQGKTAKEIGLCLGLSHRTIETYLVTLKQKLNCQSSRDMKNLVSSCKMAKSFLESHIPL